MYNITTQQHAKKSRWSNQNISEGLGVYNPNNVTRWTVKLKSNIMALKRELVKGEKTAFLEPILFSEK